MRHYLARTEDAEGRPAVTIMWHLSTSFAVPTSTFMPVNQRECMHISNSEASSGDQDDQEDTLEIKPPQRPQRERDGRGDRTSNDWERRDSHKDTGSGSLRGQDRRHRTDKHHKARHRERERDSSYRDYDRSRDDGQRGSRESTHHSSRDRRDRRSDRDDERDRDRERERDRDRSVKDAREKLNRNRLEKQQQQQQQQQQHQSGGGHSSGDEELQRRRERLLAALNERERKTNNEDLFRESRDRERSPQERPARTRQPHPHAHPDEDDDDDDDDDDLDLHKTAQSTAKRLSPSRDKSIGTSAISRSRLKDAGNRASTGSERSDASGSGLDESSTAGESGGGATDDERDLSKGDKANKEKDLAGISIKDSRREGPSGSGDNGGGPQPMDVDDGDDEPRPPVAQRAEQKDIREEDEFLENRGAETERDHVRDDDSQDGPLDGETDPIEELIDYFPAMQGCRRVEEFHCLNRIEEGTYGVVYRAKDKQTDEIVALKRLKMEKEKEGFPITSLREINTLLKAQHPNIVTVREIVVGSNMDKIYIVMDYVEHDLKSLMDTMKSPFLVGEVKTLMRQLLKAVAHMHDNWILHRDLKTSNLLLSHKGVLKVGDFGLAREYGSPLKHYTPVVVTLWYRAPELLLGSKEYSCPIDVWSVGCIFGELLTLKPMFQGKSEVDQLNRIFKELGTPSEKIWPGFNDLPMVKRLSFDQQPYNLLRKKIPETLLSMAGFNLLNALLTYCPGKRINAEDALRHEWFTEKPDPVEPDMFPTWPAKSEGATATARRVQSPKPPSGGQQAKNLLDDDFGFRMTSTNRGVSSKGTGFSLRF
ncbi:cyclin-dependent kinase 11B-like isoform X2 [Varroa destructor]|uniref:cyclin-dependent kinase n=1 Tax=Varroa destructor TaxID=109461 RepID=A0A7M7KEZ8_VARDE|nr:cyclin-dependent kinase 11B-like isoform X2 [Varroa destructor]